ncbi:TIGR02186 family protein [Anianabacter salinae]|uniref:TIGR02186 family protein n=1 Tax=Anianabacter salinae TaxID=2851023 RepID=UPI003898DD0F
MVLIPLLLCLSALSAAAEQVVAGLSQNRVSITTNFDGSEILIFGAVKRESPVPDAAELDVIVTIEGPKRQVTVRRKSRVAGIWINTDAVEVDAAPSFYAVATTDPLGDVLSSTEDLRHSISIPRAIRSVGAPATIADSETFTEALIRIREKDDLYQLLEGAITLREQTLFNTSVALPANLTEGNYRVRIFLTRDRGVIDAYETVIGVRKAGLERWLFSLAHEQPLIYGLLSLVIAVGAGWAASAVFRILRS